MYLDMKSLQWEGECWEMLNRHSHWHVWTDSRRGRKPNRPGLLAVYRPGRVLLAVYTRPGEPINTRRPNPDAADLPADAVAVLWTPRLRRKATSWTRTPTLAPPGLIAGTWPESPVTLTGSRAVAPASHVRARTRAARPGEGE